MDEDDISPISGHKLFDMTVIYNKANQTRPFELGVGASNILSKCRN